MTNKGCCCKKKCCCKKDHKHSNVDFTSFMNVAAANTDITLLDFLVFILFLIRKYSKVMQKSIVY
jgi:hypothetical protein